MFGQKPKDEAQLDEAIDQVLSGLTAYTPEQPDEYERYLTYLERLHALKPEEAPRRVTPDALVGSLTTLASVLVIVIYEQKHVWVSKAANLIPKFKS